MSEYISTNGDLTFSVTIRSTETGAALADVGALDQVTSVMGLMSDVVRLGEWGKCEALLQEGYLGAYYVTEEGHDAGNETQVYATAELYDVDSGTEYLNLTMVS